MNGKVNLNKEQKLAVELMLSGLNVFLGGKAGSGKSVVIHEFKRQCNKRLVCLAPTGVAAQLIGGSTIHSFMEFPIEEPGDKIVNNGMPRNKDLLLATDIILIDEISMVRIDILQAINDVFQRVCYNGRPFGGKQIIVVGDFFQLPPVEKKQKNEDDDNSLELYIKNKFGGWYAFETPAWR